MPFLKIDQMLPTTNFLEKLNPFDKESDVFAQDLYLCLVITDKKVKSGLWTPNKTEDQVLSLGQSEAWGGENGEELISAADASIGAAISRLSRVSGKQPGKVLFGLPAQWVEDEDIVPGRLDLLQAACKKLTLKPLGFVVTPEAIAYRLKKEEGGLPGLILVNLEESEAVVSLIVEGRFVGSKVVGRSDSLALDVEEGLLRFNFGEILPHRFLLLDGGVDLEESRQELIAYPWTEPSGGKKLNFLQLPKVEIGQPDFEVGAVVTAGIKEIGTKDVCLLEKTPKIETVVEEAALPPSAEEWTENFGFLENRDVLLELAPEPKLAVNEEVVREVAIKEEEKTAILPVGKKKISFPWWQITGGLISIKNRFPRFRLKAFLLFLLVIFIPLGTIFGGFWFLARAEVTLFVQPRVTEKEFEFVPSSKASSIDFNKMIVPVESITVEVKGDKTAAVKGKKTVGDKATGEIIIYNRTDQSKTLAKGLVLVGPAGLKFNLAEEVRVASKSADLDQGVDRWGEVRVPAVAVDIGPQYNISADSRFTFEVLSSASFLIKNPAAFSGGTSREIQAVASEDRDNLRSALMLELKDQATGELKNKIKAEDYLLEASLLLNNKVDSFSHEVGSETGEIKLEQKATFSVLVVKAENLQRLFEKMTESDLLEGYEVEGEESDIKLKAGEKSAYLAKVKLTFVPKIETENILTNLKGRTISGGKNWLKSQKNLAGVEIVMKPVIFSRLKFFPFVKQNIRVSIQKL